MMQKTLFENENLIKPLNPAFCIAAVSRSTFYQGDCLVEMDKIADKSIDMILCDLPYGTTACKWDSVIPFEPLWKHYERVIKDNGAIVLTASQPFTSALINSNIDLFKYSMVWVKDKPSNFANANKMPMRYHEDICVFYKNLPPYNQQFEPRKGTGGNRVKYKITNGFGSNDQNEHKIGCKEQTKDYSEMKQIGTVLEVPFELRVKGQHGTVKPILLMERLLLFFTNEGETVLDNCMGSGTTGVACKKTGRHFIGIEKDEKYFEIAVSRVSAYCG